MANEPVGTNGITSINGLDPVSFVDDLRDSFLSVDNAVTEAKSIAAEGDELLAVEVLSEATTYADKVAPTKSAMISLSLPTSAVSVSEPASHVRIPVKVGARVPSFRVQFRNWNDRNNLNYPGDLTFSGVFIGKRAKDSNGVFTQNFDGTPTALSVPFAIDMGADGKRWTTTIIEYVLEPGVEYLLSYGFSSPAGQNNHLGIGGCYRGLVPSAAGAETAGSMTQSDQVPLDVVISAYVPTSTPVYTYVGSSTVVGSQTPWPIRDSFASRHAIASGAIGTLFGGSGLAMETYTNTALYAWKKIRAYDKPNLVFMNLHSNDVYSTATLQTIQDRNTAFMGTLRSQLNSGIVYLNVAPRANEAADIKVKREAYNQWLSTLPNNALASYDVASIVTSATGLDPVYDSGDGVHLNALGQAKTAEVMEVGNGESVLRQAVNDATTKYGALPAEVTRIRDGSNLGTANLSTIVTPGPYHQPSNGNATLARGYPVAQAGELIVVPWGTNTIRVYYPYLQATIYMQTVMTGVAGKWKAFNADEGVRVLNTTLNGVTAPGPWYQQDKSSATLANNYPAESLEQGAGVNLNWAEGTAINRVQFFYPGSFRRFHRRTIFDGTPREWETYEPSDVIEARIMGQVDEKLSTALPVANWAHWGDSLTDDAVLGADSWVVDLAALTGKQHYNGGWYGQKTGEIAARMGAAPMLGTFTTGQIPAAGGSVYFTPAFGQVAQNNKTTRQLFGTIAGRYGHFTAPFSGNILFTPTDTVATATTAAGTQTFVPDNPYADRVTTIWAGTNDVPGSLTPSQLTSTVRAMVDYLTPRVKRFLILTLPQSSNRAVGSAAYVKCAAINDAYREFAPGNVVEIAAHLMSNQAAIDAGVTFTADDLADISNGYTPRVFRSDDIHFSAAAGPAIAKEIHRQAQARGWLV